LAFEDFIELPSRLLGLDHRFTHTRLMALCLFLPVSAKSAQPHLVAQANGQENAHPDFVLENGTRVEDG
jgi:hypothetical protein